MSHDREPGHEPIGTPHDPVKPMSVPTLLPPPYALRVPSHTPAAHINRTKLTIAGLLAIAGGIAYCEHQRGKDIDSNLDAMRRSRSQETIKHEHLEAPAPIVMVRGVAKRDVNTVTIKPSTIALKTDQCNETHPGEFEVEAVSPGGNGVLLAKVKIVVKAHHKSYTYRVRGSVQANEEGMNFAQKADLVPNADIPRIE